MIVVDKQFPLRNVARDQEEDRIYSQHESWEQEQTAQLDCGPHEQALNGDEIGNAA